MAKLMLAQPSLHLQLQLALRLFRPPWPLLIRTRGMLSLVLPTWTCLLLMPPLMQLRRTSLLRPLLQTSLEAPRPSAHAC